MKKHSALRFALALALAAAVGVIAVAVSAFATDYAVTTADEFTAAVLAATNEDPSNVILQNDVAFEEAFDINPTASGGTVTVSAPAGQSYKVTAAGDCEVRNTATLQINEGVTFDFESKGRFVVNAGSLFVLNGGTVKNGRGEKGGGVCGDLGSSIYIFDGAVENCSAETYGGGVYLNSSSGSPSAFVMTGGTVTGCTAEGTWGGGVGLGGGFVNIRITGGTISGNTAATFAGGIYLYGILAEPVTNLKVINNTTLGSKGSYKTSGAGIAIEGASKEYTLGAGTVVSGNTAQAGRGGGIAVFSGKSVVLDGVQITGNKSTDTTVIGSCAGVCVYGGSVTVQGDTLISENVASGGTAGGIGCHIADATSVTITGGTISNNVAATYGGGIEIAKGTLTMTGGVVSGNKAGSYAGGISVTTANGCTITDVTVSNNTAGTHSGGVYVQSAGPNVLSGVTITNNDAGTNGGGICCSDKTKDIVISDSVIANNTAAGTTGGGGIYFYGATGTIENCTVTGNSATVTSGGGFNGTATSIAIVTNSSFNNNLAYSAGGGVYTKGTFKAENVEICGNASGAYLEGDEIKSRSSSYGGSAIFLSENAHAVLTDVTVTGNGNSSSTVMLNADPSVGNGITFDGKIVIKDNSPSIKNYDAENKVFNVGENETAKGFYWSPSQSAKTTVIFRETLSDESEMTITVTTSGGAAQIGVVTNEFDELSETDISEVLAKCTVSGTDHTLKQEGSNVLIDMPLYSYTIVSVNNGATKEYSAFDQGATVKLPAYSAVTADFTAGTAYEGKYGLSNFIGFAEVENYGTAPVLKALYYSAQAVDVEDINGKTLYAAWAYAETAPGASVKLPGESGGASGIRFVTLLETDILARIGIKNLTAEEAANGDTGFRLGVTIYKNPGEKTQVKQTYYGAGGKTFDEKWSGDDLYTTVYPSGSLDGKHAFSIGLELITPLQYEFKFSAEAFVEVCYSDQKTVVKRNAPLPTEGDPAVTLTRTARQVAIAYAGFLASEDNGDYDETYLGLTEAQMSALEKVSGLTFNVSTKTFA
ncbi:MAG: right-handed parallel beta-helix repeat-containing protein [Clostridia bacterium]|nr:right-handed parallel beta-helix repeat-containing protein [Clostridia bacterium]